MNKLLLIGILLLTTNFSILAQSTEWDTLSKKDYSIQYPNTWELNESGQMGTSFILFSPVSSQKDQFRENVNLLIQDLAGYDLNLNKYVEISENQIKTMITDGNITESKRITSGSLDYHKVVYTGKQGVNNLKFVQYFWLVNDKAFVLTLTCEENQYDNYKVTGEKILNSFKFK